MNKTDERKPARMDSRFLMLSIRVIHVIGTLNGLFPVKYSKKTAFPVKNMSEFFRYFHFGKHEKDWKISIIGLPFMVLWFGIYTGSAPTLYFYYMNDSFVYRINSTHTVHVQQSNNKIYPTLNCVMNIVVFSTFLMWNLNVIKFQRNLAAVFDCYFHSTDYKEKKLVSKKMITIYAIVLIPYIIDFSNSLYVTYEFHLLRNTPSIIEYYISFFKRVAGRLTLSSIVLVMICTNLLLGLMFSLIKNNLKLIVSAAKLQEKQKTRFYYSKEFSSSHHLSNRLDAIRVQYCIMGILLQEYHDICQIMVFLITLATSLCTVNTTFVATSYNVTLKTSIKRSLRVNSYTFFNLFLLCMIAEYTSKQAKVPLSLLSGPDADNLDDQLNEKANKFLKRLQNFDPNFSVYGIFQVNINLFLSICTWSVSVYSIGVNFWFQDTDNKVDV